MVRLAGEVGEGRVLYREGEDRQCLTVPSGTDHGVRWVSGAGAVAVAVAPGGQRGQRQRQRQRGTGEDGGRMGWRVLEGQEDLEGEKEWVGGWGQPGTLPLPLQLPHRRPAPGHHTASLFTDVARYPSAAIPHQPPSVWTPPVDCR